MTAPTPGWYPAEGDPPGTQRYWNGSEWQGEPQAVAASPGTSGSPAAPPAPAASSQHRPYANWGQRAVALLIDGLIVLASIIVAVLIAALIGQVSSDLALVVLAVGYIAIIVAHLYLTWWLPGITGQTPGKRVMGYEIVREDNGQYLGGGAYLGRSFIGSIVNGLVFYLGWLWPLWDDKNQTWADKIFSSVAVQKPKASLFPMFPNGKPF